MVMSLNEELNVYKKGLRKNADLLMGQSAYKPGSVSFRKTEGLLSFICCRSIAAAIKRSTRCGCLYRQSGVQPFGSFVMNHHRNLFDLSAPEVFYIPGLLRKCVGSYPTFSPLP
jgi:hypothetical protein